MHLQLLGMTVLLCPVLWIPSASFPPNLQQWALGFSTCLFSGTYCGVTCTVSSLVCLHDIPLPSFLQTDWGAPNSTSVQSSSGFWLLLSLVVCPASLSWPFCFWHCQDFLVWPSWPLAVASSLLFFGVWFFCCCCFVLFFQMGLDSLVLCRDCSWELTTVPRSFMCLESLPRPQAHLFPEQAEVFLNPGLSSLLLDPLTILSNLA